MIAWLARIFGLESTDGPTGIQGRVRNLYVIRLDNVVWSQQQKHLMPTMYEHLNPVPEAEAKGREEDLAVDLQRKGLGVWWN